MECTVVIQFPQHKAHVRVSEDHHIYCFKYNEQSCDFDVFTDDLLAADWIQEPFPSVKYTVKINS